MLPLRISLQGFMSYRDATTFDFEGARLWMLAGENGAGKSTVFDALRFALFGVHRGGKIRPEQLINHESQRLVVEVELHLGEELYKLRRTLGRENARPTWDVSRRVEGVWESVAGTGMAREYERWVADNIGLTDEAFCASVYLSQGRADAILNADADARYELLSQLVDLEVYERWHERADERRTGARADMLEARKRWETAPTPSPERLVELRERSTKLERQHNELSDRVRQLEGARTDAARWEEWQAQLAALEREAAAQRALLHDEAVIARDFARLGHLTRHLSTVETFWHSLKRRDELTGQIETLLPQQSQAQHALNEAQEREVEAAVALETANRAWTQASEAWEALVREMSQIEPQRALIERRAHLLQQRSQAEQRHASFETDLNERLEAAVREHRQAQEAARTLPLWRRFMAARRSYAAARAHKATLRTRHDETLARCTELENATRQAQTAQEAAASNLRAAVAARSRVEERAQALETRRADFAQVEGEARCHFCGQELSPQHRAAELERLSLAANEIKAELAGAMALYETAIANFRAAQTSAEKGANALAEAQRSVNAAELEMRQGSSDMARERSLALVAWDELGADERARSGPAGISFETSLENSAVFLTDPDLKRREEVTQRLSAREESVTQWQQRARDHDQVQAELARLNQELSPLLSTWSDATVEEWKARTATLATDLQASKAHLDAAQKQVKVAREAQSAASRSIAEARTKSEALVRQLGPLQGELKAIESTIASSQIAFAQAVNHPLESLPTLDEVTSTRAEWEREMVELERKDTKARHQAMSEARTKLAQAEREHTFYSLQIETLPAIARRPRAEVETEWEQTRGQLKRSDDERVEVSDEIRRLEREAQERALLEEALQERSLEHARWEELARLLGPHQLQRHLLRQAEAAIVREANKVLEAISGGTLRLELVPDSDDNTTGNRRPKVLDVVCYHLSGSEELKAIAPAFLSGSQRFRVAVALALGIGRTSARGSNGRAARVETILIDEGFGALDKTGRDEMKDELRELGRELGRVILVSHQEDFARAFPNRFNITLENGVSRVQKVVE